MRKNNTKYYTSSPTSYGQELFLTEDKTEADVIRIHDNFYSMKNGFVGDKIGNIDEIKKQYCYLGEMKNRGSTYSDPYLLSPDLNELLQIHLISDFEESEIQKIEVTRNAGYVRWGSSKNTGDVTTNIYKDESNNFIYEQNKPEVEPISDNLYNKFHNSPHTFKEDLNSDTAQIHECTECETPFIGNHEKTFCFICESKLYEEYMKYGEYSFDGEY